MPTLSRLSAETIQSLPAPPAGNVVYWASGAQVQGRDVPRGFGIRITAAGERSFVLNYTVAGKERRLTIGRLSSWNVQEAVKEARQLRQRIDRGEDPLAKPVPIEAQKTVADVLDLFLKRAKLKRPDHYVSVFERFVKPAFGNLPINELRRRHIVQLLDKIEDENGAVMATRALAYFRSAMNWHAARDDEFQPPFVKGMARSSTTERARDRILTDDELRTLWPVFATTTFGRACRVMLLTSCRRSEVTGMRWDELADDVWTIPAARYKTSREHVVPLSAMAMEIISGQNRRNSTQQLIFPGRFGSQLSRGGNHKAAIDKAASGLSAWTVHDLRRTARSLMSRAGVNSDVAERVLGHALTGVRGTYDRFQYLEEKRQALELLADAVRTIVAVDNP